MTAGRILGMLCTHDEADRYLDECLAHHAQFLDQIFVWDDRSTDDTVAIAQRYATVGVRPAGIGGFEESESTFRHAGWTAMVAELQPRPGVDWIFAFDADEIFHAHDFERDALEGVSEAAERSGKHTVVFRVDEIFEAAPGILKRRIDGFWGTITAARFTRHNPDARFVARSLGGGSIPVLADWPHQLAGERFDVTGEHFAIRHFGYAKPEDRRAKYRRYAGRGGHNPLHVESILQPPILEPLW